MRFARRLDQVPPYLFAEIERRIEAMRAEGVDVISLGIGDPDLPTPPGRWWRRSSAPPRGPRPHQYPSNRGLAAFREAVAGFYERPLRRRRRPGVRGDPRPRRQGGGRPRRARLPRPRRRRARAGSRLPAVHVGPGLRRRGGALPAAPGGERVHARPRRDPAGDRVAGRTSSTSTTRTTRPARSSPTASSSARRRSRASTTSSRSTTPPTPRSPSTATGRRASSPRRARRRSGRRSSRSPRAGT